MAASGWRDAYRLAGAGDGGFTVRGAIDGWRDGPSGDMRIDYIWVNGSLLPCRCAVVLDGRRGPVVSDHFGVLLEGMPDEPQ